MIARDPEGFLICEKTDGVRYLLLVISGDAFLINRKNEFFTGINLETLPSGYKRKNGVEIHLFDGELVQDRSLDQPSFLIFDSMLVDGLNVMNLSLIERLKICRKKVIAPLRNSEQIAEK